MLATGSTCFFFWGKSQMHALGPHRDLWCLKCYRSYWCSRQNPSDSFTIAVALPISIVLLLLKTHLWLFAEALCWLVPKADLSGACVPPGEEVWKPSSLASSWDNLMCLLHSSVPVESCWSWSFVINCLASSSLSIFYFPHYLPGFSWGSFLINHLTHGSRFRISFWETCSQTTAYRMQQDINSLFAPKTLIKQLITA